MVHLAEEGIKSLFTYSGRKRSKLKTTDFLQRKFSLEECLAILPKYMHGWIRDKYKKYVTAYELYRWLLGEGAQE
jgi:hypothetical protein